MTGTYEVFLTFQARNDLASLHEYIRADSLDAANRFIREIEKKILPLANMPARTPLIPENSILGTSYRHLGKYRIIFRIQENTVLVLRIIHGARLLRL